MRTCHMAFDVCVYTQGDVWGIVQFVKQRPEILINAERSSAWAELQHIVAVLLKPLLIFCLILTAALAPSHSDFIQPETEALRPMK